MTETKKKNKWARYFAGMAACLVLAVGCFFGYRVYDMNYAVASTVSLDVNPSIQITVNKKEHVLDVTPLNEDGKTVIGEMDFSGSSIDITVNALIGSMLRCGYISELANSILISVDNGTSDSSLQDRLTAEVSALLQTDSFTGAVLSQTVTGDSALRQIAEEYGITVGKAQLINKILMLDGMKTFEELASLSINELNLIMKSYTEALDNVSSVGQASDKAYIGEAKAKEIVLAHALLTEERISRYKVEMDMENGILVYEIEFCSGDYEYEYDVNALTGEVVKHEKELDDGVHINNGDHQGQQDETTLISVEQAKELALSHAGISTSDIIFVKIDFDDEDGIKHYEIEFVSGGYEYDYDINALTGAVIKCEKELDDDDRTDKEQQDSRLISAEEAKSAALTHAGISASETLFITAELDIDNGLKCYEVEFVSGIMSTITISMLIPEQLSNTKKSLTMIIRQMRDNRREQRLYLLPKPKSLLFLMQDLRLRRLSLKKQSLIMKTALNIMRWNFPATDMNMNMKSTHVQELYSMPRRTWIEPKNDSSFICIMQS